MNIKTLCGLLIVLLLTTAAQAQPIKNAIPDVARPLPLPSVRVTGGPLKRAQDLNADYLLKLEPDRMMAYYRKRAGLEPMAQGYPGWDGDGKNLTGHIAGHYLSGVSLMFAATGDPRFKERADYLVKEMKEVQDKNGDGYLGVIDGLREKFAEVTKGNIKSTFFDLNGLWSPWYTRAYADDEWRGVVPWNPPSFAMLAPGETKTYGVKFLLSDEIRNIEKTLAENNRPVAIGIPGYVLPMDIDGRLFVKHQQKITKFDVYPAGALELKEAGVTAQKWEAFTVRGKTWGRARLALTYDDGSTQSISYYVIKPSVQAVADLGNFLFTRQWFDDPGDPFHRSPSVMSYDREADKIVTQDSRVWIAGLGDEGGSGSWLAAAMKEFGQPRREEIAKYEQFIDRVLWGRLQDSDGPTRYGVRKSLFYYSPQVVPDFKYDPTLDWTTWTSWKRAEAESIRRGYNYPHVIAAYWSMYRIARNHQGLVTNHSWEWYLDHAFETARFMFGRQEDGRRRVGYVDLGLMEGDILVALLEDLKERPGAKRPVSSKN